MAARAASSRPRTTSALWRDRNFGAFWAAQTLSVLGDGFAAIAVPLLVLQVTGSVARMGQLTAVAGAAAVGTALFAGVLVDRVDRRTLLIRCDLIRMVLYALIPVAWLFGPQLWLLYVVLPLGAAVGMLFQVAYVTAVPNLVAADRITEANGRLSASYAVAGIGGPLLAGLVSARFGPPVGIAVNAASFAVSALGLSFIRLTKTRPPSGGEASLTRARDEFLAGARFLWAHPVLRALTALLSVFIFLIFGLDDVLIYYVKHDLRGSDSTVGVVLGAAAAGTVVGALLVARLRRRWGFGRTWIASTAAAGLAIAGLAIPGLAIPGLAIPGLAIPGWGRTGGVAMVALLVAAHLGCVTVGAICSLSLRQEITPDHLLGRVTSAFWAIHFSLGPAGAAAMTWGAERYGVAPVCAIAGGGAVLIALTALRTPIRTCYSGRSSSLS